MMTEGRSQLERLLDAFVFVPVGLAQSAAEEFDRLAEKGRHRVEGQVHTARLVGQFAVQMARREAKRMVEGAFSHLAGTWSCPGGAGPGGAGPGGEPTGWSARTESVMGGDTGFGEGEQPASRSAGGSDRSDGSGGARDLAIPGYDSLSASQVVQRLDGLSLGELEEVKQHELAHRHRRTILNRVEQLLAADRG